MLTKEKRVMPRKRPRGPRRLMRVVPWLPVGVTGDAIITQLWGRAPGFPRIIVEILVLLLIFEVLDLLRRLLKQDEVRDWHGLTVTG